MFTGLIEAVATIVRIEERDQARRFAVSVPESVRDIKTGDSVCIDGVCLTAEKIGGTCIVFSAVAETLRRTALKKMKEGQRVNLERALRIGDRLGGHWVSGHIDCVGEIVADQKKGDSVDRWIRMESRYLDHVAEKGSIAVDGVSLTVALRETWGFSVALIPHTLGNTTAGQKHVGSQVNIETDILAKYAEALAGAKKSEMTLDSLKAMGY